MDTKQEQLAEPTPETAKVVLEVPVTDAEWKPVAVCPVDPADLSQCDSCQ